MLTEKISDQRVDWKLTKLEERIIQARDAASWKKLSTRDRRTSTTDKPATMLPKLELQMLDLVHTQSLRTNWGTSLQQHSAYPA
jgi:hypothetical protein